MPNQVNINIVKGKIFCKKCSKVSMYQKVNEGVFINLFICKNCKNSINRDWLKKYIKVIVEQTKDLKGIIKKGLEAKIETLEGQISNYDGKLSILNVERNKLSINKNPFDELDYKYEADKLDLEIKYINRKKKVVINEKELTRNQVFDLVRLPKKRLSDNDGEFKSQIKDIIEKVYVWKDVVTIDLYGMVRFKVSKPNANDLLRQKRGKSVEHLYKLEAPINLWDDEEYSSFDEYIDVLEYNYLNKPSEKEIKKHDKTKDQAASLGGSKGK